MAAHAAAPIEEVIVETNWILDVALHRNQASEELLLYAEQGHARLFLPSFCLAEAVKAVESILETWQRLGRQLKTHKDELRRSAFIDAANALDAAEVALATAEDIAKADFWATLARITDVVTLQHATSQIVVLTGFIGQILDLTPADAFVLATVVMASQSGLCTRFMSRDNDFAEGAVVEYLALQGVTFHPNPLRIVGPIRSRLL